jgi:hypothetical protein
LLKWLTLPIITSSIVLEGVAASYQETLFGGVEDDVYYLRCGSVKFNARSLKIRHQEALSPVNYLQSEGLSKKIFLYYYCLG